MRKLQLMFVIGATSLLIACGDGTPTECTQFIKETGNMLEFSKNMMDEAIKELPEAQAKQVKTQFEAQMKQYDANKVKEKIKEYLADNPKEEVAAECKQGTEQLIQAREQLEKLVEMTKKSQ